jgi:acetolactate synthase I/II/III large subunit
VALFSERVTEPAQLPGILSRAFALFASARPGPVHIEIPLDVMGKPADGLQPQHSNARPPEPDAGQVEEAARMLAAARRPLILAGGGAKQSDAALRTLAERADAPVVTTSNGRGLLHRHALGVPASPSLKSVRALMAESDCVLAAGTEFGPTDYDMYADGGFVLPPNLIRIDVGADQLQRRPVTVGLQASCEVALPAILQALAQQGVKDGAARAEKARQAAWAEIGPIGQAQVNAVEAIRDALPGAVIVGDSTQPIYAANLYYDHDRPGRYFSAATGFGALGYGPPAAVGAAIALADAPVVCLTGDGGFQFTLAEIGAAVEARTSVIYLVWNNRGYREIEESMRGAGVEPVGVSPLPPDFTKIAEAYGVAAERITAEPAAIGAALKRARNRGGVALVEIAVD